jgi:ribosomal protein S12 methylthiotransferase accessory factor
MSIFPLHAVGGSLDKTHAEISAICEALERYCGVMKNFEDDQIYISYSERQERNLLALDKLPACENDEYANLHNPICRPKEKQKYFWTKCHDLINNCEIYVPSSFVFLKSTFESKKELLTTPNSTGTAGGQSIEQATVNALLEALERDALMLTWLNQLPRDMIDVASIKQEEITKRIGAFRRMDCEVFLFDIRSDFAVPVILCIIKSSKYPFLTVTAAAKLNVYSAVQRALDEAYTTRNFGLFNKERHYLKNYDKAFSNVVDFEDHYALYNKPHMQNNLDFLIHNCTRQTKLNTDCSITDQSNYPTILEYFTNEFKKRNYNLIVKDLTTSDIADSIFKFVKVISPELIYLSPNHNYRYLANTRIKNVLPLIGFADYQNRQITNLPHPFA